MGREVYDAAIIGAGMSGLAAGIRLAQFGMRVCILEKHTIWGGLNSFYKKGGRRFDVGLHAMTNYAPRGQRGPLSMICRQLRLDYDALRLRPQRESEIRFPSAHLCFGNDLGLLETEVARSFPEQIDGFRKLLNAVKSYDDGTLDPESSSARLRLSEWLSSPLLTDMVLCPLMFYGSATEHDMNWHQFVIMFKAIFLEGFCRPEGGVRSLLEILRRAYAARGGELRLRTGVERLLPRSEGGVEIACEDGDTIVARKVLSSAGKVETARLLGESETLGSAVGTMSFVETIFCLDRPAAELGWVRSIIFFSHRDPFEYRRCPQLIDAGSGAICCPENFESQDPFPEGILRVTSIANYERWLEVRMLGEDVYRRAKSEFIAAQLDSLAAVGPPFLDNIAYEDAFTPLTIQRFTSHLAGAIYGAPDKALSGATSSPDVHLCGTDQGYLGIVGALLSGVLMANRHVLMADVSKLMADAQKERT